MAPICFGAFCFGFCMQKSDIIFAMYNYKKYKREKGILRESTGDTLRIEKNGKTYIIQVTVCQRCGIRFSEYPHLDDDGVTKICPSCAEEKEKNEKES